MKLYGYVFLNNKVGAYTDPQWQPYDLEMKKEMIARYAQVVEGKEKKDLSDCEFYYLGVFDDKTGKFDLLERPEFICDFRSLKNE